MWQPFNVIRSNVLGTSYVTLISVSMQLPTEKFPACIGSRMYALHYYCYFLQTSPFQVYGVDLSPTFGSSTGTDFLELCVGHDFIIGNNCKGSDHVNKEGVGLKP